MLISNRILRIWVVTVAQIRKSLVLLKNEEKPRRSKFKSISIIIMMKEAVLLIDNQ